MQAGRRHRRGGQVVIEHAIALMGVVMFLYLTLKVWNWFNYMIIARQASFQATRFQAGQQGGTNTVKVPFRRRPLRLVGQPGMQESAPDVVPSQPPCQAAKRYYDEAKRLFRQHQRLLEQAATQAEVVRKRAKKVREFGKKIQDCGDDDDCVDHWTPYLNGAEHNLTVAQHKLEDLRTQSDQALTDAQTKMQEGNEACPHH